MNKQVSNIANAEKEEFDNVPASFDIVGRCVVGALVFLKVGVLVFFKVGLLVFFKVGLLVTFKVGLLVTSSGTLFQQPRK